MSNILDEFDDWIEEKGVHPYKLLKKLFSRAKIRAKKLEHIEYYRKIKEFPETNEDIYCEFIDDEFMMRDDGGYITARDEKDLLKRKEPDYDSVINGLLLEEKQRKEDRKASLFFQLRELDTTREEIIRELEHYES